jgi:hypothetical protein
MRHSNAVHQDINVAVGYDSLHDLGDRGLIGSIADMGSGFPARSRDSIDRIPGLPWIDIEDMNVDTSSRKRLGNGLADPTAGPVIKVLLWPNPRSWSASGIRMTHSGARTLPTIQG